MNLSEIFVSKAKKSERSLIVSSVLTLVIGIMLAIYPDDSLSLLTKIIAIGLMLIGIYEIITFFKIAKMERIGSASFALGVVFFAGGLYLFINDAILPKFITTFIGVLVCIKSVYKIQIAISIKDYSKNWKYSFVSGIIVLSLGIVMIFHPNDTANTIVRILGILLTLSSIYEIVESITIVKKIDKVTDAVFIEKKK